MISTGSGVKHASFARAGFRFRGAIRPEFSDAAPTHPHAPWKASTFAVDEMSLHLLETICTEDDSISFIQCRMTN